MYLTLRMFYQQRNITTEIGTARTFENRVDAHGGFESPFGINPDGPTF